MDREFYNRIAKRRGDPKYQSVNNPTIDFYGEKVGFEQAGRMKSLLTFRSLRWRLTDVGSGTRRLTTGKPCTVSRRRSSRWCE